MDVWHNFGLFTILNRTQNPYEGNCYKIIIFSFAD